jgi:hypothetical protein
VHRLLPAVVVPGHAWSGWLGGLPTRSVGQQPARWAAAVERTAWSATAGPCGPPAELSPGWGSRLAPWGVQLGHGGLLSESVGVELAHLQQRQAQVAAANTGRPGPAGRRPAASAGRPAGPGGNHHPPRPVGEGSPAGVVARALGAQRRRGAADQAGEPGEDGHGQQQVEGGRAGWERPGRLPGALRGGAALLAWLDTRRVESSRLV